MAEGLSYLHSQGIVHGDIKPHNVLVSGKSEGDYNFKITDYSGISSGVISQLSFRSSSLKQFMTPGYLAPELISDVGDHLPPNKPSDIYSFGILTYEVYFCTEPWPNVSMQLLNAVKRGHRPVIPANGSKGITSIIKECWQHDSMQRPSASEVSRLIQEQLETESPIPSAQNYLDDVHDMLVDDCSSNLEMCADQNLHDEDTYTNSNSTSSNLSCMCESNNADLVVSRSSVSEENSHLSITVPHSEIDENPANAQMITHGIGNPTNSCTCLSFSNNDLDHAKSIL